MKAIFAKFLGQQVYKYVLIKNGLYKEKLKRILSWFVFGALSAESLVTKIRATFLGKLQTNPACWTFWSIIRTDSLHWGQLRIIDHISLKPIILQWFMRIKLGIEFCQTFSRVALFSKNVSNLVTFFSFKLYLCIFYYCAQLGIPSFSWFLFKRIVIDPQYKKYLDCKFRKTCLQDSLCHIDKL